MYFYSRSTQQYSSFAKTLLAALLLAFVTGCSTLPGPTQVQSDRSVSTTARCTAWFEHLDAAIDRAGVRDAGAYRLEGFPYLRIDRLSASLRDQAKIDSQHFNVWLARLMELDAEARGYEIRNLPAQAFPIDGITDQSAARVVTQSCANDLARDEFVEPTRRNTLVSIAQVPDNYSNWKRTLGLYPLTSIPFAKGVEGWQREATDMFAKGLKTDSKILRYAPAVSVGAGEQVTGIFQHSRVDALGIPQFTDEEQEILFKAYAPAYEIETTGTYDLFGPLSWRGGEAPEVDVSKPVVFRRMAFTRFHGEILPQLVYTIWFPEHPANSAADFLAGKLDGNVFRVTLGTDGTPIAYDTIHPCGCYHMFFPTARVAPLPAPEGAIEWAFIPQKLPATAPAIRMVLSINSRSHYLVNVRPDSYVDATTYQLEDDNSLRAIETKGGGTRSAFGPDGLVPGTERLERYTFWPMGIDNSGAMRQWGTHATAFVGKRHFDDADIIERRFAWSPDGNITLAPQQ